VEFTPFHRGGSGPPLVLLHGFFDTWRVWELVLPALEREREVLAVTLAGHAGGPPLPERLDDEMLADAAERAMDDAGFELAQIAGNSLGGFVALQLAARGRARNVVAFSPAGGWEGTPDVFALQAELYEIIKQAAPHADALMATPEGRRAATRYTAVNYEHIPAELLAHQTRGAALCDAPRMLARAREAQWRIDAERIACPVRIVWGTEDALLPYPASAARLRRLLPHAEWVELDGAGHCPQLDVPLETAQLIL
jgi:pimeloyl-ACP methyl ester carboxylesterase